MKFQKIFEGAYLRIELFLLLNQLQICSAEKKNTLENFMEIMAPHPFIKFFATPLLLGYKLAKSNLIFCCFAVICPDVSTKIGENFTVMS